MKRMWRGFPLRLKIFLSFGLLLAGSTVAVSLYASFIVTQELDQQTMSSVERILLSSSEKVQSELALISQQTNMLANNYSLQNALKDYEDQTDLEKWYRWRRIWQISETWYQSRSPVDFRLHLPREMLFLRDNILFVPNEKLPLRLMEAQGANPPWWHVSEDGTQLSCLMPMRSGWVHLGYAEVVVQSAQLSNTLDDLPGTGISLYLLFYDGSFIAGNTGAALPQDLVPLAQLPARDAEPAFTRFHRDGESLLCAVLPIPGMPRFVLVGEMPNAFISQTGRGMLQSIVVAGLVVLVLAFLIAFLLSQSVTKRLRTLSDAMDRLEGGDLGVQIGQPGDDELGRMLVRFDRMASALNRSQEAKEQSRRLQRESELRLLQAQINPHFIHNTLESISWAAKRGDAAQVEYLVQNLSGFLRLSLTKTEQLGTLARELKLVQFYCNVQSFRFSDRFSLEMDIQPEAMDALMLSLLIQPLVENALLHGILASKKGCGTVLVCARVIDDLLLVEVRDDGVGMDAQALEALRRQLEDSRAGSYGLWNVHQRVRSYAGEDYGLSIESAPDEGLLCILSMPVLYEMRSVPNM
ncbi:MAG TPA: histidine kinase [Clostridia bacterium]|nr:histidine kinase [Clostridia bacterium]